jgi:hypothetical protein
MSSATDELTRCRGAAARASRSDVDLMTAGSFPPGDSVTGFTPHQENSLRCREGARCCARGGPAWGRCGQSRRSPQHRERLRPRAPGELGHLPVRNGLWGERQHGHRRVHIRLLALDGSGAGSTRADERRPRRAGLRGTQAPAPALLREGDARRPRLRPSAPPTPIDAPPARGGGRTLPHAASRCRSGHAADPLAPVRGPLSRGEGAPGSRRNRQDLCVALTKAQLQPAVARRTSVPFANEFGEIQRNLNPINFRAARASNPLRIEAHTIAL